MALLFDLFFLRAPLTLIVANTPYATWPHPSRCNPEVLPKTPFVVTPFTFVRPDVLQWARENDCPWDERSCALAARAGRLDVLKWCRSNGCRWNGSTCSFAAGAGRLEVLKWARQNGCPWDRGTIEAAATNGRHPDVLEWCRANGCPED